MEHIELIEAKRVPNPNDELGRDAVKIRARVEDVFIEFDEAVYGGQIDEAFSSLFLLGSRHPIRGVIEDKLGGTKWHSVKLHQYLVDEANKQLGGLH